MTEYQELFEKYPDTAIIFGDNPAPAVGNLVLSQGIKRMVLFTGKHSADADGGRILGAFFKTLSTNDVEIHRFKDIPPEPSTEVVEKMAEFLQTVQPDAVTALGGGSVMDAAKAAWLICRKGGRVQDYFGSNMCTDKGIECDKIICFPTTSGTGSEVTPYSNIVDSSVGVKKLISDPVIIPSHAFVMPSLAMSMSPEVTRATGCDALAHLLEGFLNVGADSRNPEANRWALTGIKLIADNLEKAINSPDKASREAMAAAATLGGMVIRYKSTGLPHLCSFSWYGIIEHGIAVSMLLPGAWRYYQGNPKVAERTMELKEIFHGDTPEEIIASYQELITRCGVPASIKDVPGLTDEVLERTARSAGENPMKLALAPRPVKAEEAYSVITGLWR